MAFIIKIELEGGLDLFDVGDALGVPGFGPSVI